MLIHSINHTCNRELVILGSPGIGLSTIRPTIRSSYTFIHSLIHACDRELVILDSPGIGLSTIQPGAAPTPQDYFRFQAASVAGLITTLKLQQPDVLAGASAPLNAPGLLALKHSAFRSVKPTSGSLCSSYRIVACPHERIQHLMCVH